jgi:hypothetical protein
MMKSGTDSGQKRLMGIAESILSEVEGLNPSYDALDFVTGRFSKFYRPSGVFAIGQGNHSGLPLHKT